MENVFGQTLSEKILFTHPKYIISHMFLREATTRLNWVICLIAKRGKNQILHLIRQKKSE